MPYPSMSEQERRHLQYLYDTIGSLEGVRAVTGRNIRTIMKYVRTSRRLPVDKARVVALYKATGTLTSTAHACGRSTVTVWRILRAAGVVVGRGASDWRRLYVTLRARVSRSGWRKVILERDGFKCVECHSAARNVHHEKRLSEIRDDALKSHPELDPLRSRAELRLFTDLVMEAHERVAGVTLCSDCHDRRHTKPTP